MRRYKIAILLSVMLVQYSPLVARVWINTTDLPATMDVVDKPMGVPANGEIVVLELTGNKPKTKDAVYVAVQTETMVCITVAPSPTTDKIIHVTAPSYYVFNRMMWTAFYLINICNTESLYLGRGSHYCAAMTFDLSVGKPMNYTTMIVMLRADYQVHCTATNQNSTVLEMERTESCDTTNGTVQKQSKR